MKDLTFLNVEWSRLMHQFNLDDNKEMRDYIIYCYSEAWRYYHDTSHLISVIRLAHDHNVPPEVKMALWFHDIIYIPGNLDNKLKSANLAYDFCKNKTVQKLIMSTSYRSKNTSALYAIMRDIDWSIFSADFQTYSNYERNIRLENKNMTYEKYVNGRIEFLKQILKKPVYLTKLMADYEDKARENIEWSLENIKNIGCI